jgi:hypothetical protein
MRFFPNQDMTASLYVVYISALTHQLLFGIHIFKCMWFIHYLDLDYTLWLCKHIIMSDNALKLLLPVFVGTMLS